MSKLFLSILNMSPTASYVIIAVIAIRLLLKKVPKAISYALWSIVAFRLLCPFSFESVFSLLPKTTTPISQGIVYEQVPQINSGINNIDQIVNNRLPVGTPVAGINSIQIYIEIGTIIWAIGIIGMLLYSIVSIILLRKKLRGAEWIEENIYEANNLKTPFVLGVIRPKIYLPVGLDEDERHYILKHEQAHIKRYDHIIKPLAFFILALHWFNPLVWAAFILMSRDMELSCDEKVLKEMDKSMKKPYANSLLSLATGKPILNGSPLAFGEGNVRGRIKNVLNYKKPPFWIIITVVIMVGGLSVGLVTNPKTEENIQQPEINANIQENAPKPEINANMQEDIIEPASAQWFPAQATGADMAVLDYASDDIIIFHGYFGLYVYDLNKREIIRSLDLQAINCAATQGEDYCDVVVSMDGNTVQLHPMSSENMYVYTVSDHTLKSTVYEEMEEPFRDNFVFMEDVRTKISFPMGMGVYAYNVVEFKNNEYGYLYSTEETVGTLYYRRGDKLYSLFVDDAVISSVKSASVASIVITYENPTGKEILYGGSHLLERLNGMEWINIPLKPGVAWRDIQNRLGPNQFVEEGININRMHGILSTGYYRIIKPMKIDSTYIDVITEFDIIKDVIILDSEDLTIE